MTQRTTVALDADVLAAVKALARQRHASLGQAMSDLLRESLSPSSQQPGPRYRNGLYIPGRDPGAVVPATAAADIQDLIDAEDGGW